MASCGVFSPKECKDARTNLLSQLKKLSDDLDKGHVNLSAVAYITKYLNLETLLLVMGAILVYIGRVGGLVDWCCNECCRDSPFKRKEREEFENPCVSVFPPHNARVPPGVNPNRRARPMDRPRVTMDGRTIDDGPQFNLEEEFDRYPSPPWFKPRPRSQELRAGVFHMGCDCYRRNGLQDDCQRTECGLPECLHRPPDCEPSEFSPLTGVRIPNMRANEYHNYNRY